MAEETVVRRNVRKTVLLSLAVYAVWVLATYLLEGRIRLFHRPDPMGRMLYALVANLLIGICVALALLRYLVRSGVLSPQGMGLRPPLRTLILVVIFGGLGFGLFVLQKPASLDPVIVLNVFSQVLPVSIAEVVVCWAVVGTAFEALGRGAGKVVAVAAGIVAADALFGIYHLAHSAPFNTWKMIFFLMLPGLGTSLVFFLARELYATVVFHNFFAIFGVMETMNLEAVSEPAVPLYVMAAISVATLVSLDLFAVRRTHHVA